MGWMTVIAINPLVAKVPTPGLLWLIARGLSYTIGVIFLLRIPVCSNAHLIWHLFVLAGTAVITSPCSGMLPNLPFYPICSLNKLINALLLKNVAVVAKYTL